MNPNHLPLQEMYVHYNTSVTGVYMANLHGVCLTEIPVEKHLEFSDYLFESNLQKMEVAFKF